MNKTSIKNFAIWARNKLIADIQYRAGLMGITVDGIHLTGRGAELIAREWLRRTEFRKKEQ